MADRTTLWVATPSQMRAKWATRPCTQAAYETGQWRPMPRHDFRRWDRCLFCDATPLMLENGTAR